MEGKQTTQIEISNKVGDLEYTFKEIINQIKGKAPHLSLREKVDEYTGVDWYGVVEHTCMQIDHSYKTRSRVGKLNMHADCADGLIYDQLNWYDHTPFLNLLEKTRQKLIVKRFKSMDDVASLCAAFKRIALRLRN